MAFLRQMVTGAAGLAGAAFRAVLPANQQQRAIARIDGTLAPLQEALANRVGRGFQEHKQRLADAVPRNIRALENEVLSLN